MKKRIDELLDIIHDMNPEAIYYPDLKNAIIGYVERFGMEPLVLMDRNKCIDIFMKEGMTLEEAEQYFEFNTFGSWVGEGTPAFATLLE